MDEREFFPELLSRRGELNAWIFTFVISLSMGIMAWKLGKIPRVAWLFGAFLLFAALSISFGNWMDRRTTIKVGDGGIAFENGIRKVAFRWHEVARVNVIPARWGKTVQVIGEDAHFEFRTLGEVQYQGEVRGRMGFADGEALLQEILQKTGLTLTKEEEGRYYYARS